MIDDKTLAKMEDARHLLEPPADKVVGDLLNEFAALKARNEELEHKYAKALSDLVWNEWVKECHQCDEVEELEAEITALKADNERMAEAITEWARPSGLAALMWKEQPVNMALFKIAAQRREGESED